MQHVSRHNNNRRSQGCDRINLSPEDRGDVRHKDVTHQTPTDSRQHPQGWRGDGTEMISERLLGSDDREQRQSDGIENEQGSVLPPRCRIPVESDDAGKNGYCDITPVANGGRRHRADEDVARNAAEVGGDEREDENAKEIELFLTPAAPPLSAKTNVPAEIKHQQKGVDHDAFLTDTGLRCEPRSEPTTIAFTPVSSVGWITGREARVVIGRNLN